MRVKSRKGSSPFLGTTFTLPVSGRLAQLVEHLVYTEGVGGSIPSARTISPLAFAHMKKILFITATRLGDAVLSTCVLDYFIKKYPSAQITVACGPLVVGFFSSAPGVCRVIPMKKRSYARHWLLLGKDVLWTKWDIVIDLRNSLLSRLLWAPEKIIWSRPDKSRHKVEQLRSLLPADGQSANPCIWLNPEAEKKAAEIVPSGSPVLAIGPAAKAKVKTWPAENFIELIQRLIAPEGIFSNARVAVIAAPGEEGVAMPIFNSLPADCRIDVIAKTDPVTAAAVLKRCSFYIGNDSGLMHMAAAMGVPTLGLFGPSWPHMYHPWGDHCTYVSTPENYDQLIAIFGRENKTVSMMQSLTVNMAFDGVRKLLSRAIV